MAKQTIGVGTVANDGTGDPLRDAMVKVNANFTELYTDAYPSNTVTVGNSSVNAFVNSTSLVFANTASVVKMGNSTVNTVVNSSVISIANSTKTAYLSPDLVYTGNSTANVVVNTYAVKIGTINSTAVGVVATNSSFTVGNTSANAVYSQSGSLVRSNTSVNSTANSTTLLLQTNTTVNTLITATSLSISNGTSNVTVNAGSIVVSTNTFTFGSSNVGASNFTNGYSVLPNGLLMQWGKMVCNTSTGAQTFSTVTGVAFNNVFSMTATTNSISATVGITALSNTGYTMLANTVANVDVYWTAIGK